MFLLPLQMPCYPKKCRKKLPHANLKKAAGAPAKHCLWMQEQMDAAIKAFKDGWGINRAARDHGIPPTMLKDRISGKVQNGVRPSPRAYLSKVEEDELEAYLISSAGLGYGKTRWQVKAMVEGVATFKG